MSGQIEVIAPARLAGYADNGKSVILSNGRIFDTKCVLLGTGYQSSWANIFKGWCCYPCYDLISLDCVILFIYLEKMAEEIGINRHAPQTEVKMKWNYNSLKNAPTIKPENEKWVTTIYRGLIPAKNIEKRDLAIAGATVWDLFLLNNAMCICKSHHGFPTSLLPTLDILMKLQLIGFLPTSKTTRCDSRLLWKKLLQKRRYSLPG